MRILHVLYTPRAEGTVRIALDWLAQPAAAHEVLVLCPRPAELTAELRQAAASYQELPGLPAGPGKFPWLVSKVWAACRRRRPDMVICWPNGFAPWVLLGARLAGVRRLVTHAGNPPTSSLSGRLQTFVSTFAAWACGGRMVCCSRYVASEFARSPGAFPSVLRVVYNCAPAERIARAAAEARLGRSDRRPRLIMVATLEGHKDHATLLRAMPQVLREVPDAQLWLAGDGSLRAQLTSLKESLGLGDAVEFLGSQRDIPRLLGQSDLFVFSTTPEEGLGTVLVEALAAGLPIVATDVPACRELLEGGRWGRLVPAAQPQALARAVVDALGRRSAAPEDRSAFLQQFTPTRMIEAYVQATA